jgi:hypothetical protein
MNQSLTEKLLPFKQSRDDRVAMHMYINDIMAVIQSFSDVNKDTLQQETFQISSSTQLILRSLTACDIEQLERNGCCCHDWSKIFVMIQCFGFAPAEPKTFSNASVTKAIEKQIRNCTFSGMVVVGVVMIPGSEPQCRSYNDDNDDLPLLPGIQSNTMISNCIMEPGCKVYNNGIISNTFIGCHASVFQCGSITHGSSRKKDLLFCDEMIVHVGPEAGGDRSIKVYPESTLVDVCSALSMGYSSGGKHGCHEVLETMGTCKLQMNVICGTVDCTQHISNIFVSPGAMVKSSSCIQDAILLPQSSVINSIVNSVFLQWNASIVNHSNVSNTLLMEYSEIGPNSVVASTILGPDSHVSCGEVHCSVIGPNTNAHHQSLLISTLWPMGRGNVGYGSNIGSNHTGRIPDQECTVGEGIFWGLGSVIKFPVDLSRCCYSVVAAGVQLPPQSIGMPFSLIMSGNGNGGDGSDGMNEIVPGWLLHSSPYTILRSEEKFKKRRKAKRHDYYCGWSIIRPGTVDACMDARARLISVKTLTDSAGESPTAKAIFTEKDISELGKNYMTTRGLQVGIGAYTNLIQRYALGGLLELFCTGVSMEKIQEIMTEMRDVSNAKKGDVEDSCRMISWPILPWEEISHDKEDKILLHKIKVLSFELPSIVGHNWLQESFSETCVLCLKKLCELEMHHASQVYKSKKRDDQRGVETIPGYRDAHVAAEKDPVVLLAQNQAQRTVDDCRKIMSFLQNCSSKL